MIQSGKFDKRVELQQAAETRNKTNAVVRAWATVVTRWAEVKPLTGQEKFDAGQMEARTDTLIRIRYYAGLDTTWRVKRGALIYNINAVVNDGADDSVLLLQCTQNKGRQDGA